MIDYSYTEGVGRILASHGPEIPEWQKTIIGDLFSVVNTMEGAMMRLYEGEFVEWETQPVNHVDGQILVIFPMAMGLGRNGYMPSGEFVLSVNDKPVIDFRAVKYSTLWEDGPCRFYYEVKRKVTEPETATAGAGYLLLPAGMAQEGRPLRMSVRNRIKQYTFRARGHAERWFRLDSYNNPFHQNTLTKGGYKVHIDRGVEAVLAGRPPRATWEGRTLLFGDLHAHTGRREAVYDQGEREFLRQQVCNCGIQTPEEHMHYARHVSNLDFFCITDHHRNPDFFTERDWQHRIDVAERWHSPPDFVTLLGVELVTDHGGHWNLYFRDAKPAYPPTEHLGLQEIIRRLKERDDTLMLVPHQVPTYCMSPVDWDLFDQALSPIVEIYSHWGSGEYFGNPLQCRETDVNPNCFVDTPLRRGHKLGFIGSTDEHGGAPGDGITTLNPVGAGLACAWAKDIAREGVYDALAQRYCYATTGVRMKLTYTLNGTPMGQDGRISSAEDRRVLRVAVDAPEAVDEIVIIKNSQEAAYAKFRGPSVEWEWVDESPAKAGDYYYPRVVLKDGETAWASPVWLASGE